MGILALCFALHARAAEPPKVVIVGGPDDRLARRLGDELRAAGMRVELLEMDEVDPLRVLDDHAGAALARVASTPPMVRVWIRGPGDVDEAVEVSSRQAGEAAERVIALRAVEVLRAELLPVDRPPPGADAPSPTPTAGPVATPPRVDAPPTGPGGPTAQDREWIASAYAGPSLFVASGGLPAVPQIQLGSVFRLVERLAVDAFVLVPTMASTVDAADGEIDARVLLTGAGPSVLLTDPGDAFAVAAQGGVGVAVVFVAGEAAAPLQGEELISAAFAPHIGLTMSYWFNRWVGLRLDTRGLLLLPTHGLRAEGATAAELGPGAGAFSMGVEVRP